MAGSFSGRSVPVATMKLERLTSVEMGSGPSTSLELNLVEAGGVNDPTAADAPRLCTIPRDPTVSLSTRGEARVLH